MVRNDFYFDPDDIASDYLDWMADEAEARDKAAREIARWERRQRKHYKKTKNSFMENENYENSKK